MSDDFQIRAFRPGDLTQMQAVREVAFRPVFKSLRQIVGEALAPVVFAEAERAQADLLDQICAEDSADIVFVAEQAGDIVGFCSLKLDPETKVGEIGLNAVDPVVQREGLGTAMYVYALDIMRAQGMIAASVGTGGDPSHAPARRAYKKAGFARAVQSVYLYRTL